jgi:hypothetical protein
MLESGKIYIIHIIRFITVLWIIIHFTLTLAYVAPPNPVQANLEPLLKATIGTYFFQDWNLFAPSPRTADLGLLVRPLTGDEFKVAQIQGLPKNGWYDLSAPLWTIFQSNRFVAYYKFGRIADRAIVYYLTLTLPRQQGIRIMVELASAFCKDIGQNHATFVALVIYERQSKPWPERTTSKQRVVRTTLVGIYPVDRSIKKMNLYRIGG